MGIFIFLPRIVMNNSTRNFTNSSNAQNNSSFKDKLKKLTTGVALAGTLMVGNASCTSCSHEKNIDQEAKAENVEVKAEGKDTLTDEKTVAFTDVQESSQTKETAEEEEAPLSYEKLMEGAGMGDELREIQEQAKLRKEYDSLWTVLAASEEDLTVSKKELLTEIKKTEALWAEIETDKLLNMKDFPQRLNKHFKNCKDLNMQPSARALELQKLVNSQKGRK